MTAIFSQTRRSPIKSYIHINIKNYKKTDAQMKEVQNRLDHLLKQIPYNSCISLDFDYKNKTFYGKLKVVSVGKTFFSTEEGVLLPVLTNSLCKKVQKQVKKWKKSRSLDEITGVVSLNPSYQAGVLSLEEADYKKSA